MEYLNEDLRKNICFVKPDFAIVKTIALEIKDKSFPIGGFSDVDYNKKTDELFLISDNSENYVVKIKYFSKIIKSSINKIFLNQENIIKLKYGFLNKIFSNRDSEGLVIKENSMFILNENKSWDWRRYFPFLNKPSTLEEYETINGKKIKSINLPNSFLKETSGIEALTVSNDGLFLLATEGNYTLTSNNLFKIFLKPSKKENLKPFTFSKYLTINKNFEISKVSSFPIGSKLNDLYLYEELGILLALTKDYLIKGFKIEILENKFIIKDKIFELKIPIEAKWEGITKGPKLHQNLTTLLLVNDNDYNQFRIDQAAKIEMDSQRFKNIKDVPNIISIFSFNYNKECPNEKFNF